MDETQKALPLPFPELSGDMPLLPVRMVNEYQYCPRLAYLEWVQGERTSERTSGSDSNSVRIERDFHFGLGLFVLSTDG